MNSNESYYSEILNSYSDAYKSCHGYVSLLMSIFGVLGNVVNIVVFTRKSMASSTNTILTALATADMLLDLLYIPFAYIYYIQAYPNSQLGVVSELMAYIAMVSTNVMPVAEVASVWLTVMLSGWRCIAIYYTLSVSRYLTTRRTKYFITAVYCLSSCVCVPLFLTSNVIERQQNNITLYTVDWSVLQERNRALDTFFYCFNALVMRILPSTCICIFTILLIRALRRAKTHRRKLTTHTEHDSEWRRINKMLLTILLLFSFTELPSGILLVLSEIIGSSFFTNVYQRLSETLQLLNLVNHCMNCIIYYAMIRKYRETFYSVFCCSICKKKKNTKCVMASAKCSGSSSSRTGSKPDSSKLESETL